EVHQDGLRVYTTLNLDWQRAANQAALDGLAAYERRHGWKDDLRNILGSGESLRTYRHPDWEETITPGSYVHGLVIDSGSAAATLRLGNSTAALTPNEIACTGRRAPKDLLQVR